MTRRRDHALVLMPDLLSATEPEWRGVTVALNRVRGGVVYGEIFVLSGRDGMVLPANADKATVMIRTREYSPVRIRQTHASFERRCEETEGSPVTMRNGRKPPTVGAGYHSSDDLKGAVKGPGTLLLNAGALPPLREPGRLVAASGCRSSLIGYIEEARIWPCPTDQYRQPYQSAAKGCRLLRSSRNRRMWQSTFRGICGKRVGPQS